MTDTSDDSAGSQPFPRFGTPEYDALKNNGPRFQGPHIHKDPTLEAAGFYYGLDHLVRQVDKLIKEPRPEADMHIQKPRFDWTWNVGNLIVVISMIVSVGVAAFVGYGQLKDYQAATERQFDKLISTMEQVQKQESQNRSDIELDRKATSDRVLLYAPQIEAAKQANAMEDDAIKGLRDSTRNLQGMVADLLKATTQTHEDVAIMKTRMDMLRPPGPHSEIPAAEPATQVGSIR